MLSIYTTIQNQYRWYGTHKQNWSHHNIMSRLTITSTQHKHTIQPSNTQTPYTDYSKQMAINTTIPSEMNPHIYSLRGIDVHPENLTPDIETCQESLIMTATHDDHHSATQSNKSTQNTHNNTYNLSIQDLVILHANNIFPQNKKDDLKTYKHLHSIDMQIHSIPKPTKQKARDMGLSDLHE
jgi:hypothetical protein